MRVLVTGHLGYIGVELVSVLLASGHEVVGLDTGLFNECDFVSPPDPIETLDIDLRDVKPDDVRGFDAVAHLGALSNDPLGDINPQLTYDINLHASVRLAEAAKAAGVGRFLFSSSCSLYGAGGDLELDEHAAFYPVTAYGESKVRVEQQVSTLADEGFSPVYLRNATAYGVSRRLRADIVVNNLVGHAVTTGKVLLQSDGTPWRPLVHIRDIIAAFEACLTAPVEAIHNEAFNVGQDRRELPNPRCRRARTRRRAQLRNRIRTGSLARHPQLPGRLRQDRDAAAGLRTDVDAQSRNRRALSRVRRCPPRRERLERSPLLPASHGQGLAGSRSDRR